MESKSPKGPQTSDEFTRNPEDRYLTPVPPKPLPSPRLGDLCKETYTVPMHPFLAPRSATYPMSTRSLSPGFDGRSKSASTSPHLASTAVFPDLRCLKEKLAASKRSQPGSRGRSAQRNVRGLDIGSPTLISTTAEEMNLVPLPPRSVPQTSASLPAPITAKLREFSPLGSHPVNPTTDLGFGLSTLSAEQLSERPRSHTPSIVQPKFTITPGRVRANSADTRRTRHYNLFPNEPWVSTPKLPSTFDSKLDTTPVLQKPTVALVPPSVSEDERPTSRHGADRSPSLHKSPLDKDLPALPRYLVPAPLFACNNSSKEVLEDEEDDDDCATNPPNERCSNLSMWSAESMTFSCPTLDEDIVHSPTFSSLTSNSSEAGSPQRLSDQFAMSEENYELTMHTITKEEQSLGDETEDASTLRRGSSGPPMLRLPVPSFGSNVFQIDIQHAESAPRRQAACFGLSGFQGYSLPEDEAASQATITKASLHTEPTIESGHATSASQLDKLMDDFGFLGEAVI